MDLPLVYIQGVSKIMEMQHFKKDFNFEVNCLLHKELTQLQRWVIVSWIPQARISYVRDLTRSQLPRGQVVSTWISGTSVIQTATLFNTSGGTSSKVASIQGTRGQTVSPKNSIQTINGDWEAQTLNRVVTKQHQRTTPPPRPKRSGSSVTLLYAERPFCHAPPNIDTPTFFRKI